MARNGHLIRTCGPRVRGGQAAPLAGEPPLLDVGVRRERARVEAAEILWRDEQRRRREAEVVRLFLVEETVEGVVALLPRRLAAIARRGRARGVDRLVRVGRAPGAEVVT